MKKIYTFRNLNLQQHIWSASQVEDEVAVCLARKP
jgi:hypothetical protein